MITLRVFDNSGETLDRYTVIIGNDVYNMSHNANMPNGCNYYSGSLESIHPEALTNEVKDIKSLPDGLKIGIVIRLSDPSYKLSIFDMFKLLGVEIDHHEFDLYAKVTPVSEYIIDQYEYKGNVTRFHSGLDTWFEIPFAFDPFWKDKADICKRYKEWKSQLKGRK